MNGSAATYLLSSAREGSPSAVMQGWEEEKNKVFPNVEFYNMLLRVDVAACFIMDLVAWQDRTESTSPFSSKPSLPFLAFLPGFSDTFWMSLTSCGFLWTSLP